MQPLGKSQYTRPHKKTYKVSKELAATICESPADIKSFAFYISIKHCFESSIFLNWRSNIPKIKRITGINSENTIRKRIKECYKLGFLYGTFKDNHLQCKKTEKILWDYRIPAQIENVTSIAKSNLRGVKQIETWIKVCAFQIHRERQIYAAKRAFVIKGIDTKSSDKELLTGGLGRFVRKQIRGVDDKKVLHSIRTGRRKLGSYIQRSGSTATRVIEKAKKLRILRDVSLRPQIAYYEIGNHAIDYSQSSAREKYKTFAFYKDGHIWIKYANSVSLNPNIEFMDNKELNTKLKEREFNERINAEMQENTKRGQSVCFTF